MKKHDKTKSYSDLNKTSIYEDIISDAIGSEHLVKSGDMISLNNKDYHVSDIISDDTAEAVIYKIQGSDQKVFILKLYHEFSDPDNEPNPEALERIKNITDEDILKLYEFGTGINRYQGKYCFEISDFAYGNDLLKVENLKQKYKPGFIENKVVPQIFKGILRLHKNKIYHCDLKAQNVFYLDEGQTEIVIGDYGSAKTFEFDAAKKSRKTTTVKGTDFYLPPEQARGFISEKNDYYSFGMILLHLFYPEKILLNTDEPKSLSHLKLKQIIERQFEAKPIIDYDPKFERINKLIEGLTLVDFNLRWGKEQVEQWIKGEKVNVIYSRSSQYSSDKELRTDKRLIFGKHTINTVYDLREYILDEPNWYSDLIEDKDNRKDFTDWMLDLYKGDKSKRSAFNRIIKEYSQDGIEFIGDALIRFFVPEYTVFFGLKEFDLRETDDLKKTTALAFYHLINNLWENSSENDLKLYLFRFELSLGQLTDKNEEVSKLLNILYRELKIKKTVKSDFFDYYVDAYYSFTKKSKKDLEKFLCSFLPVESVLEYINTDDFNQLHYKLKKSASEYYKKIGISYELEDSETEELITIKYPRSGYTTKDFFEKTTDKTITDICEKHRIDKKEITGQNRNTFEEKLKSDIKKQITDLSKKHKAFRKSYGRKIRKAPHIKKNIIKLEAVTVHKNYHELSTAFELLNTMERQAKRLEKKLEKESEEKRSRRTRGIGLKIFIAICIIWMTIAAFGYYFVYSFNYVKSLITYENIDNKEEAISKIEMVFVEEGKVLIEDLSLLLNTPADSVKLIGFYIGKYEITNAQYSWFLNLYGSDTVKNGEYIGEKMISLSDEEEYDWGIHYKNDTWQPRRGYEDFPVIYVSWYGANEFCKWAGGRLPTASEWVFAAEGGNKSKNYLYSGGDNPNKVAWYDQNSRRKTHQVGRKRPNELGLYDMSGNVCEWSETWDDKTSKLKLLKGGGVFSYDYRTEPNDWFGSGNSRHRVFKDTGFRLCKDSIN